MTLWQASSKSSVFLTQAGKVKKVMCLNCWRARSPQYLLVLLSLAMKRQATGDIGIIYVLEGAERGDPMPRGSSYVDEHAFINRSPHFLYMSLHSGRRGRLNTKHLAAFVLLLPGAELC